MKNSRFLNVISCFLFCFVFSLSAFINGLCLQGRRSLFSIEYGGGGGKKGRGGLDNKRQGREFVGGSGAILPQKSLKSTGPEISGVFNNLREVISRKDSDRFYIFKIVVLLHSSSSFNVFFILHACLILKNI